MNDSEDAPPLVRIGGLPVSPDLFSGRVSQHGAGGCRPLPAPPLVRMHLQVSSTESHTILFGGCPCGGGGAPRSVPGVAGEPLASSCIDQKNVRGLGGGAESMKAFTMNKSSHAWRRLVSRFLLPVLQAFSPGLLMVLFRFLLLVPLPPPRPPPVRQELSTPQGSWPRVPRCQGSAKVPEPREPVSPVELLPLPQ
jgi:hypothetical protein